MRAHVHSVPAPVGGLNARDSVAAMPETDALTLQNWFPEPDYVRVRRGFQPFASGVTGGVISMLVWAGPVSSRMFAASASAIYDVTAGGAAGTAALSGLSNGDWMGAMMATSGGNFLVIANGADAVRSYNGSAWSTPAITGATSFDLVAPFVHKRRLWFVEENTTKAWYLGTDAIAGAATSFDLGPMFQFGGSLLCGGTITRDGGTGPDDYACFVSTVGEVVVYAGTDPASASTWAVVGSYYIPPPLGRRCLQQVGGDLMCLTEGGLILFSAMMALDRTASDKAAVSSKINRRFNSDAILYSARPGWAVATKPRANMLLVNVPGVTEYVSEVIVDDDGGEIVTDTGEPYGWGYEVDGFSQYAMNTLTGAWSFFKGQNSRCWALFNEDVYFGDSTGTIYLADAGYLDNGSSIQCDIGTSYSSHGSKGRLKSYSMVKPYLEATGNPGILLELNTDYDDQNPTITPTADRVVSSLWGTALWGVDQWGDASTARIRDDWQGVVGVGMVGALRLRVTTAGSEVKLYGFDVMHEPGGML